MNTTEEVTIGQIVKSKAGRDRDRIFVIIGIVDEQYVLIADGDLRKIDKAKKKKIKHLAKYNIVSNEIANKVSTHEKISNLFLRRELEKLGVN